MLDVAVIGLPSQGVLLIKVIDMYYLRKLLL